MRAKGEHGEKGARVGDIEGKYGEIEGGEEKEMRNRGGDRERYWEGEN